MFRPWPRFVQALSDDNGTGDDYDDDDDDDNGKIILMILVVRPTSVRRVKWQIGLFKRIDGLPESGKEACER